MVRYILVLAVLVGGIAGTHPARAAAEDATPAFSASGEPVLDRRTIRLPPTFPSGAGSVARPVAKGK